MSSASKTLLAITRLPWSNQPSRNFTVGIESVTNQVETKLLGLRYRIVFKVRRENSAADALSRHTSAAELSVIAVVVPSWLTQVTASYQQEAAIQDLLTKILCQDTSVGDFWVGFCARTPVWGISGWASTLLFSACCFPRFTIAPWLGTLGRKPPSSVCIAIRVEGYAQVSTGVCQQLQRLQAGQIGARPLSRSAATSAGANASLVDDNQGLRGRVATIEGCQQHSRWWWINWPSTHTLSRCLICLLLSKWLKPSLTMSTSFSVGQRSNIH
jgi:hypothetical protein